MISVVGWKVIEEGTETVQEILTALEIHGDLMNTITLSLTRKVYNQCILPVLTYALENWHRTK